MNTIVRSDEVGGVRVSTVEINLVNGPPFSKEGAAMWETMVFGGPHDREQWRYHSLKDAQKGHRRVVKLVGEEEDNG